jgi:hypothetical protein
VKQMARRMGAAVVVVAGAWGLGGCASISQEQCRLSDPSAWERLGRSDAQGGNALTRLNKHQEACAKVGVLPDDKAYVRGWSQGVLEYCTPHHAREVGRSGSSGNGQMCPGETGKLFQANWVVGNEIHQAESQVSSLQGDIRNLEKQVGKNNNDPEAQRILRKRILGKEEELQWARKRLATVQAAPMVLK